MDSITNTIPNMHKHVYKFIISDSDALIHTTHFHKMRFMYSFQAYAVNLLGITFANFVMLHNAGAILAFQMQSKMVNCIECVRAHVQVHVHDPRSTQIRISHTECFNL